MERFVTRHDDRITGILAGFDRMLFRGTATSLQYLKGMEIFLSAHGVLLKDFGAFGERVTARVIAHATELAERHARPYEYLASSAVRKDEHARAIAAREEVTEGLICVLSCVEPCRSYSVAKDRTTRRLRLVSRERKCLHLYFYYLDREFGLMHLRLQTWLPLTIQVCVNGREWLAREMTRRGLGFTQVDNSFTALTDVSRAQLVMDQLSTRHWAPLLTRWARRVNPWLDVAAGLDFHGYYWSLRESEYATDVMFRDRAALQTVYPALVQHAITEFGSEDVLRFLGRRAAARTVEVTSQLTRRVEGVRVKHRVAENSIKMYDKHGCLLRIETTINNPRRFKVRRLATRGGRRGRTWIPMRKGIADIPRRVEISRAANARYLEALSVVGEPSPSHQLLDPVSLPVVHNSRRYRPLRPISPQEAPLLRAVLRGEYLLQGFRNADLCLTLYPAACRDPGAHRRAANRVTRLLRLLRAHGLIQKVSTTRYYRVTPRGHATLATALRFRDTDIALLAA